MAINVIKRPDGAVQVWFRAEEQDSDAFTDPQCGVLIGQASSADVALSGAVANLAEAVQDLANRQRLSAVEGYKRREPV